MFEMKLCSLSVLFFFYINILLVFMGVAIILEGIVLAWSASRNAKWSFIGFA